MLFEQFEEKGLSHYSYAVGCPGAGAMAIVDPRRDIDIYIEFAQRQKMRITHVLETHIHADYASGARELAQRSGAALMLSAYDKGEIFEVAFPRRQLRDRDCIELGSVRLQALHTPGHTPEHLSFLVYDTTRSSEVPEMMLSGDFLFVGSLGRPDLLGEEAKIGLAKRLFCSVRDKLAELPDGLEVYPAHGSGSMCGAGMSGRPHSTLGFERTANPYLQSGLSEQDFVDRILSNVPPFPPYYRRMKKLNSEGPPLLNGLPGSAAVEVGDFRQRVKQGAAVIDLRNALAFGAGHIEGAFGIGYGGKISEWASWLVPYDTPLLLVMAHDQMQPEVSRALVRVGLDSVQGYLKGGIEAWTLAGLPLRSLPQIDPLELARRHKESDLRVIDVRSRSEWDSGHIAGAVHVLAGQIADNLDRIPDGGTPLAIICATGYRSTAAASVLSRHGFKNVLNAAGGMTAWEKAGLPVER